MCPFVCVFQVDISLNSDQLKEEIDFLKHAQSMKKTTSAQSCRSDAIISKKKDKRNSGSFEQYSESIKLLMEWVNAVCAFYNKKVSFFVFFFSSLSLSTFWLKSNFIHKIKYFIAFL